MFSRQTGDVTTFCSTYFCNGMQRLFLTFVFLAFSGLLFSQADSVKSVDQANLFPQRSMKAVRITVAPKIDGVLADSCWTLSEVASDFIQRELRPDEPSEQKEEVRLIYDDEAIYISAQMYDVSPDSVLRELSTRDNEANADLFGVFFDTYNDDINAYGFFVTSAGTQIDARYSIDGQDFDWNAVWISQVKINEQGWAIEMKIPYSALRFSKKEVQTWGFNIIRKIRRTREMSFWNRLNPVIGGLVRQFGDLTGLQNIKPPVRLSFSPYVAGILNHYPYKIPGVNDLTYTASGGMDVKYGLSDAFTLDMTLVPDFSQVQSDNQVLNLSPFEVQFQERRPFFTEGTELFNRGGLFYSRRVGGTAIGYYDAYYQLNTDEKIIKNPTQTQLLNATKLSGRTAGKLGIGVFNAVSNQMFATVQDTMTGNTRKILTSPFTNYNIVVLDQAMKNNSSIYLVNTNVTREGHYYDANVTGSGLRLNNRKNTYTVGASGVVSNRFFPDSLKPYTGYAANLDFGKSGGNFTWAFYGAVKSDRYNPNDLGILFLSNNMETGLELNYNIYKPFWKLNNIFNNIYFSYQRMFNPNAFWNFGIYGNTRTTFKKNFFTCGVNYGFEPVITYDYYEPRIPNHYYTFPINYNYGGFISTDYRKKFALDISSNYRYFIENDRRNINFWVSPRYRMNNKLSFIFEFSDNLRYDDIGFVNYNGTDITFGKRNMNTVSNTLSSVYKFTNKMSLSFRLRHYWSSADYKGYYTLGNDGYLSHDSLYANDHNVNFNAFNIDMVFFWQFAPGSELNLVWKSSLLKREGVVDVDYYNNFKSSLNSPQNNMISLKVLYYLDYLKIKKAFS